MNTTERIARAIWDDFAGIQGEYDDFVKEFGRDADEVQTTWSQANAVIRMLQDSGIPIDKLISGEYVAVPVEPSKEMLLANCSVARIAPDAASLGDDMKVRTAMENRRREYRAMLTAHKESLHKPDE